MDLEKFANQDEEIGRLANSMCSPTACRVMSHIVLSSTLTSGPLGSDGPVSKMWALCISHVDEHDPPMLERWRSDMDGILIYVRFQALLDMFTLLTFANVS
jgi:hypothetical protein